MAEISKPAENGVKASPQTAARSVAQKTQLAAGVSQKNAPETGSQALTSQQRIQLLKEQQLRQARAKLGPASFASTSPEILRKFAKYPPSISFHIYETHYRFNNTQDSSIIPKDSPMARSFLQHLIREEIPVEMTELLKDFAVRFYDGCLVVQVYDHRNMVPVSAPAAATAAAAATAPSSNLGSTAASTPGSVAASDSSKPPSVTSGKSTPNPGKETATSRPKTYRTLLRPTPQSLYYDLLYHTDSTLTKFTDLLSLQMEAEILTLTNRKLDLAVPLNPYLQDELLRPEIESPTAVWDEKKGDYKVMHSHREPSEVEVRKLHQDSLTMQKSSEFEEMMFLLSSKYKHPSESTSEKKLVVVGPTVTSQASESGSLETTPSVGATAGSTTATEKSGRAGAAAPITSATSVLANGSGTSNQFMRLRFIEEIRKRKESQKAQAGAAVAAHTQGSVSNNPAAALAGTSENGAFPRSAQQNAAGKTPLAIGIRGQQGPAAVPNGTQQQQQVTQIPAQASQNQFQQNQQFQKQQQTVNQQRQSALYAQQGVKAQQSRFPATPSQVSNGQRQIPPDQGSSVVGPGMAQDFSTSPLSQNARVPQGIARQNVVMQNNQKLGQAPVQQQQLAKQADRIRAQQFQVQQARQQQQQIRQQAQSLQQNPQASPQNFSHLKQQQQAAQLASAQAAKRQKLGAGVNQISQQNQYPQPVRTPQMGNLQQPGSNMNTPIIGSASMANNGLASSPPQMAAQVPQSAQGQATFQNHQNTANNRPATQPALGQTGQVAGQKTAIQQQQQRQQQQQIFQMTLTPQEQHTFRQLQARMNTLLQMSNTGVAPNRARLTAQQQQQALQQAKHIQQQLLQRFPTYFQRLRQYQALQDERLLAMQRQQAQGQSQSSQPQTQSQSQSRQQNLASNMGMSDASMYSQQNVGMNTNSPAMQQQMMSSPMMSQMNNGMQSGQGNSGLN